MSNCSGDTAELIGFSATTSDLRDALKIACRLKQRQADLIIVFSAAHISSIGVPILERFPEIDDLCIGEDQSCLLDLANERSLREIDPLLFPDSDGKIVCNRRRPLIV